MRIELEAALARHIPVVPVLVGHAVMPAVGPLPATLAPLAFRQSIEVRPDPDLHHDATRLVSALRRILDPSAPEIDASPNVIARAGGQTQAESSWRRRLVWMVAGVAIGMIALAVPTLRQLRETPPPEMRTEISTPATDQPGYFALLPDGSAPTRLAPDTSQAVYLPAGPGNASGGDGWLLWARARTLVAQRLDLERQTLAGDPVTLAEGMGTLVGTLTGGWSVAASGLVAYRTGAGSQRQLMWVGPSGMARGTSGDADSSFSNPRVSPPTAVAWWWSARSRATMTSGSGVVPGGGEIRARGVRGVSEMRPPRTRLSARPL